MSYFIENGCTVCLDTPENRAHFDRLKAALQNPSPRRLAAANFQAGLAAQTARENKRLRALRTHLPGYEPDR